MLKDVKRVLFDAGRLHDVHQVLDKIAKTSDVSIPVNPYCDNGRISFRVNGKDAADEASLLRSCIDSNNFSTVDRNSFDTIYNVIKSEAEIALHNYAVTISHRKDHDEDVIEKARVYMILQNMLDCMYIDGSDWSIPDGWKNEKYTTWFKEEIANHFKLRPYIVM